MQEGDLDGQKSNINPNTSEFSDIAAHSTDAYNKRIILHKDGHNKVMDMKIRSNSSNII